MRRVLITGGAGFLGHHLALQHAADGDLVCVVDSGARASSRAGLLASTNIEVRTLDLCLPESWRKLDKSVDVVYHLAALNGTPTFYSRPLDVLGSNGAVDVNAARWTQTLEAGTSTVYASSSEVYAGLSTNYDLGGVSEDAPTGFSSTDNVRWSYACSKIAGEIAFLSTPRDRMVRVARVFNVYGPGDGSGHVIPDLIERIIARQDPFTVYGLEQSRSFCYVEDAVSALRLLAGSQRPGDRIFNLGSQEETTISNLLDLMFEIAGWRPEEIVALNAPEGSVARRKPDITRITSATGWTPSMTLRQGLTETFYSATSAKG